MPPISWLASITIGLISEVRWSSIAAVKPAGPAPMMIAVPCFMRYFFSFSAGQNLGFHASFNCAPPRVGVESPSYRNERPVRRRPGWSSNADRIPRPPGRKTREGRCSSLESKRNAEISVQEMSAARMNPLRATSGIHLRRAPARRFSQIFASIRKRNQNVCNTQKMDPSIPSRKPSRRK
jgi:hypothetical protein